MAVLLACAACGGNDKPLGPAATVPQATTTTNPYAVPPVIDEAYVNHVLAGLDQAVGDITRLIVNDGRVSDEAADRLEALYIGNALALKLQGYQGGRSAPIRWLSTPARKQGHNGDKPDHVAPGVHLCRGQKGRFGRKCPAKRRLGDAVGCLGPA